MRINRVVTVLMLVTLVLSSISVMGITTGDQFTDDRTHDKYAKDDDTNKPKKPNRNVDKKNNRNIEEGGQKSRFKNLEGMDKEDRKKLEETILQKNLEEQKHERIAEGFKKAKKPSLPSSKMKQTGNEVNRNNVGTAEGYEANVDYPMRKFEERYEEFELEGPKEEKLYTESKNLLKLKRTDCSLTGKSHSVSGTWNGTINITNDVYVQHGTTLEIENGTEIYFNDTTSPTLYINGTLKVNGTADNEILFTSNATTPSPGDWGGIYFNSSVNETDSFIKHANVSYADRGVTFNQTSPPVTNCNITMNQYGVLGSEMNISDNNIIDNGEGVLIQGIGTLNGISGPIDIQDNDLSGNNNIGINVDHTFISHGSDRWVINIIGNEIRSNGVHGIYATYAALSDNSDTNLTVNITVENNKLIKNGGRGLFLWPYCSQAPGSSGVSNLTSNVVLHSNNASHNDGNGIEISSEILASNEDCVSFTNLTAESNDFYNNTEAGFFANNLGDQNLANDYTINMSAKIYNNLAVKNQNGFRFSSNALQKGGSTPVSEMYLKSWDNNAINNTKSNFEIKSLTDASNIAYSNITANLDNEEIIGHNRSQNGIDLLSEDLDAGDGASVDASISDSYIYNNTYGVNATGAEVDLTDNDILSNGYVEQTGGTVTTVVSDDFEDGTLNPWTRDGAGDGQGDVGVSTDTSQSGSWSMYTQGGEEYAISPYIDLSSYSSATLSYWIRQGGAFGGSEDPEEGEDLESQYLTDTGDWQTIQTYLGGDPAGTIYTHSDNLPADALHPNFRIRFHQTDGSWTGMDYWHIDDVTVEGTTPGITATGMGVRMVDHTDGSLTNNIVNDNGRYGVYTDASSTADWTVDDHSEVYNNSVKMNGNVTVTSTGKQSWKNGTMKFWQANVHGRMEAIPGSTTEFITNNVTVNGDLWLNNTVWRIDSSYDGEYHINVTDTGHMVIRDGSDITRNKTSAYEFWIQEDGTLEVYNQSTIEYCGWQNWTDDAMHSGLWINSNDVWINDTTISNGFNGVVSFEKSPTIENSTIENNSLSGIYTLNGSSASIHHNDITNNGGAYNHTFWYSSGGTDYYLNYTWGYGIYTQNVNDSIYENHIYSNRPVGTANIQGGNNEISLVYAMGYGIQIERSKPVTGESNYPEVINNDIHDNGGTANPGGWHLGWAYGYGVSTLNSSVEIIKNDIQQNNGDGKDEEAGHGIHLSKGNSTLVENNLIKDHISDGVSLTKCKAGIDINDNLIQENDANGIYVQGEVESTIRNNDINNNDGDGIYQDSNSGRGAAVKYSGDYNLTYLAFGFEAINGETQRDQLMNNVLDYFGSPSSDDVLLIDDDQGENYQQWYNQSLESRYTPGSWHYWDTSNRGTPPNATLEDNETVIWFTGDEASGTLNTSEQENLSAFLDKRGALFISGQDIGSDIGGTNFYEEYLRANFVSDRAYVYNLEAQGDAVSYDQDLNIRQNKGDGVEYEIGSSESVIEAYHGSDIIYRYQHLTELEIYQNDVTENGKNGLHVDYAQPHVHDNPNFSSNDRQGIYWHGNNVNATLNDNTVSHNKQDGMWLHAENDLSIVSSNIYGNNVSYNHRNGIKGEAMDGNIYLYLHGGKNTVEYNWDDGIRTGSHGGHTNVSVGDVELRYNGVGLTILSNQYINGTIEDSNISHNEGRGICLLSGYSYIDMDIKDTKANYNSNSTSSGPYSFGLWVLAEDGDAEIEITSNCEFDHNGYNAPNSRSPSGVYLRIDGDLDLDFHDSRCSNNSGTGMDLDVEGKTKASIHSSDFNHNGPTHMGYGLDIQSGGNINATVTDGTHLNHNNRTGMHLDTDDSLSLEILDGCELDHNGNETNDQGEGLYAHANVDINKAKISSTSISHNEENGAYMRSDQRLDVDIESTEFNYNGNQGLDLAAYDRLNISSISSQFSHNGNGVYLSTTTGHVEGTMNNDLISYNDNYGVVVHHADGLDLISQDISENGNQGLYLHHCINTEVYGGSDISSNSASGVYIEDCPENSLEIYGSIINSNGNNGVYVDNSAPYIHDNTEINHNGLDSAFSNRDGIHIFYSHGVRIENNLEINNNENNGICTVESTGLSIESNIIKENYRGLHSRNSELVVGNNTIEYNLGSGSSNEGGGITAVKDTDLTLYNNHISHNLIYGVYTDKSSTSNWYVDGSAKAESNMLILRGNIEIQSDGFLTLKDIQGSLPNGLSIGIYLRSERNNEHRIEVNAGGEMNVINSRMSSYSGDSYIFVVRGDMELTGATISRAYTIELHSNDIQIEGSTIRDGWHGGIAVHSSSPTIEGSSLINNTYYGLYLNDSAPNIDDLHISDNREGILLEYTNVTLRELDLSGNDRGIRAEDDSSFEVYNSTLSSSGIDFYLMQDSTGWVVNTDFDKASSRLLDTSELHVNWYCDVVVKDHHGNAVSGAAVNIYNKEAVLVKTGTTNDMGRLENLVLKEYMETSSGKTYITEHNFTAVIGGTEYSLSETIDESKTVTIEVNSDPAITSTPITEATEDEEYYYNVEASDTNLDSLYFSLTERPTGMSIDHTTGEISWTPTNGQVGNHSITVKVVDDHGGSNTQTWTINVTNINDAPDINSSPVTIVLEDQVYEYDVEANDVDVGDTLSYSLTVAPDNMSIDSSGLIEWTPTDEDVGQHNIFVKVEDPKGASDTQSYTITVQNVNDAPVIHEQTLPDAEEDTVYSFFVEAHDIDDDPLVYTLTEKPSGMSIDTNTGEITWKPTNEQVGTHDVTVKINDGNGGADHLSLTLTVLNVNDGPEIISEPVTVVKEDSSYVYRLETVDIDGDVLEFSLKQAPNGMDINMETGRLNWTPENEDVGEHTVTVEVTDGNSSVMQSFELTVNNVNDAPFITSEPQKNVTEDSEYLYDVEGVDVDDDKLIYSLSEKPTGMTIEQSSGVISWIPSDSDVGEYEVKVKCIDGNGGVSEQKFVLKVKNLNDAPHLSGAGISPKTGDEKVKRTFRVTYQDEDGDAPSAVYVVIDGERKEMKKASTGDENYSKGVVYKYKTKIDSGTHLYRFEAEDGQGGTGSTIGDTIAVEKERLNIPLILLAILLIVLIGLVILDIYWWKYKEEDEEEKQEPKKTPTLMKGSDQGPERGEEGDESKDMDKNGYQEDVGDSEETDPQEGTGETDEEGEETEGTEERESSGSQEESGDEKEEADEEGISLDLGEP